MAIIEKDNFKDNLWKACDKLRNNMDPAEYKYVVLGLVFLKYISDILVQITKELADTIRKNMTIDWYDKESVQAQMRRSIRRL